MKRAWVKRAWVFFVALSFLASSRADCSRVVEDLKLPISLRTGGKPRTAKWQQVEKTLSSLRDGLQGHACDLRFDQVFSAKKDEVFFPLIGNVIRTAPEESLVGLTVFSQDGFELGKYENRVTFEKQGEYNYTHYYFQFRDSSGDLQSSGNRLLVDVYTGKPFFLVKWEEIRERIAVATR